MVTAVESPDELIEITPDIAAPETMAGAEPEFFNSAMILWSNTA